MNKYLKMLKSEKGSPGEGSKGSKVSSEPFEPDRRDRFPEMREPAQRPSDPSEPFEPARGDRFQKMHESPNDGFAVPPDCIGALRDPDGGLYLPWGPYVNPAQLATMQRELFEVVGELAKLEGWRDDDYDHTVYCIERQPISTLRPDLAHFRERLEAARADAATRAATRRRAWRFDR